MTISIKLFRGREYYVTASRVFGKRRFDRGTLIAKSFQKVFHSIRMSYALQIFVQPTNIIIKIFSLHSCDLKITFLIKHSIEQWKRSYYLDAI